MRRISSDFCTVCQRDPAHARENSFTCFIAGVLLGLVLGIGLWICNS